jgi:hypothetical protein
MAASLFGAGYGWLRPRMNRRCSLDDQDDDDDTHYACDDDDDVLAS